MEIAMPARDMMLDEIPMRLMGMKASRTDTGMVMMGTTAEGMCQRKSRMTRLTITISRSSSCSSVAIESRISSDRS